MSTVEQLDLFALLAEPEPEPAAVEAEVDPIADPAGFFAARLFGPDSPHLYRLLESRRPGPARTELVTGLTGHSHSGAGGGYRWDYKRAGLTVTRYSDEATAKAGWPDILRRALEQITPDDESRIRAEHAANIEERTARLARFEVLARRYPDGTEVTWTAPYDCGAGPAGTVVDGWRCWFCGEVEPGDYLLGNNHSLWSAYAHSFERVLCGRQELLCNQARHARKPAEQEVLDAEVLGWMIQHTTLAAILHALDDDGARAELELWGATTINGLHGGKRSAKWGKHGLAVAEWPDREPWVITWDRVIAAVRSHSSPETRELFLYAYGAGRDHELTRENAGCPGSLEERRAVMRAWLDAGHRLHLTTDALFEAILPTDDRA